MNHPSYPAILEKLSQLEDPYKIEEYDLLALGITTEMIPDLIETILTVIGLNGFVKECRQFSAKLDRSRFPR